MIIRNANIDDLKKITALEAICFPSAEAASEASFKKRLEAFPESFLVAEENGEIIGFINGSVTNDRAICDEMFENTSLHNPEGAYQAIFGYAVHPNFRKKGIAAALMDELVSLTKSRGKKGLTLTCKEHLIEYYARFGYKNLGISASVHGGAVWYDMILEF